MGNYGQLINAVAASPLLPSTSSAVTRVREMSFFQTCRKDRERHKPMTSTDHVVVYGCLWAMDGILVCRVSDVSVVSWWNTLQRELLRASTISRRSYMATRGAVEAEWGWMRNCGSVAALCCHKVLKAVLLSYYWLTRNWFFSCFSSFLILGCF